MSAAITAAIYNMIINKNFSQKIIQISGCILMDAIFSFLYIRGDISIIFKHAISFIISTSLCSDHKFYNNYKCEKKYVSIYLYIFFFIFGIMINIILFFFKNSNN